MAATVHSSAHSLPFSARVKSAIWEAVAAAVAVARIAVVVSGRTRKIDTIIYKADRLGDWLLAGPTIARLSEAARARGGTAVVWAGRESAALRAWRPPDCPVEAVELEPKGCLAKMRRALAVVRLLAVYEARTFVCLRYSPEPVRNFVLAHVRATEIHAMSWLIAVRPQLGVPHEIFRHYKILEGLGLAPDESEELLPKMAGRREAPAALAVLAPYSSAAIKDWRDEGWCEIAAELFARGFRVELWVGPNQTERASTLARKLAGGEARTVGVRSGSLAALADAIAAAAIVLSADTFAAHLATALDVPMVCVLGGGQHGDFAPWRRSIRQRWVTHPLPCFNCDWRCSRSRVECLEDISPAAVMKEIEVALRWEPHVSGI
jgi:hypothetical protein